MKNITVILALLCELSLYSQRIDTVNGNAYFQLKHGLWRDSKNNVYLSFYDTISDMHKRNDVIHKMGTKRTFLLRDHIDTTSFYRLNYFPFAYDKKYVYFFNCHDNDKYLNTAITIIEGADPATFKIHERSEYEAEDKSSNYYLKNNLFEIVSKTMKYKDVGRGFYRGDNGKLYISTDVNEDPGRTDKMSASFYREVPNIDIKTYDDLGSATGYAKDKNNVYWRWSSTDGNFIEIVEKADPLTFKVDIKDGYGHDYGHDKSFNFDHGYIKKPK